jgi:tyrosyl-tRNA synthetase
MSISDDLMWRSYTLLTDLAPGEVLALRGRVSSGELHPKQAKVDLAKRIVADFQGAAAAEAAAEEFERRFARKELPDDLPVIEIPEAEWDVPLERMLVRCGLASSMSDARRKLQQGGVRVNGERQGGSEPARTRIDASEFVLQAGKLGAVRVVCKRG